MISYSGITGGIISLAILYFLARNAEFEASVRGERYIVKYDRWVRLLGWIFLFIGIGTIYGASLSSQKDLILACVVGTLFGCGTSVLWIEFNFIRIEFDKDYVYTFSPWRKNRKIIWEDIYEYSYSDINKWHILKTRKDGNIRLSIFLSGLGTFFQEMDKRKLLGGQLPSAQQTDQ
jgi:hypothetical protein